MLLKVPMITRSCEDRAITLSASAFSSNSEMQMLNSKSLIGIEIITQSNFLSEVIYVHLFIEVQRYLLCKNTAC